LAATVDRLTVGGDIIETCGASRADPVALEGIADRFLPECTFRGRDKRKLRFAVLAVAAPAAILSAARLSVIACC
jgi:hypothetical protein